MLSSSNAVVPPASEMAVNAGPIHVAVLGENEFSEWDAMASRHPLASVYHLSHWKRGLEDGFTHIRGQIFGLKCSTSGRIVGGLPVYEVNSWLLGRRIVSAPFATFCDPLVSSERDWNLLWPHIVEFQRRRGARSIELKAYRGGSLLRTSPDMQMAQVYKHHVTALHPDLQKLRASFSRTAVQRMIGKAEKAGVTVRSGSTVEDLRVFYRFFHETRRRLCLPPIPFRFLEALVRRLGSDYLRIFVAEKDGEPIGGVLTLKFRDMISLEFSGDRNELRNIGINQFLYWSAAKYGAESGYKLLGFGRTSIFNQTLLAYKKHWSTTEEDLPVFRFPTQMQKAVAPTERSLKYRLVRGMIGKSPLPVYNMLGAFAYRHIG